MPPHLTTKTHADMALYQVVKTYGHDLGLSCTFRQWRADSHCNNLHGYAISVQLVFETTQLDAQNWVIDFGSLKPIKDFLHTNYDHVLLVANDDPAWTELNHLGALGLANVRTVDNVGCEGFAKHIADYVTAWLRTQRSDVTLAKVTVQEQPSNAATYIPQ